MVLAVDAPGGVEVNEEVVHSVHRRIKVGLIQLQHRPVPRDLELHWLLSTTAPAGYAAPAVRKMSYSG
jgi:hypothetical protein